MQRGGAFRPDAAVASVHKDKTELHMVAQPSCTRAAVAGPDPPREAHGRRAGDDCGPGSAAGSMHWRDESVCTDLNRERRPATEEGRRWSQIWLPGRAWPSPVDFVAVEPRGGS